MKGILQAPAFYCCEAEHGVSGAGACMLSGTFLAVISPEGWLDPEAHESDLRGSRGVAVAGGLLIFMGVANFRNTVKPSQPTHIQPAAQIMTESVQP